MTQPERNSALPGVLFGLTVTLFSIYMVHALFKGDYSYPSHQHKVAQHTRLSDEKAVLSRQIEVLRNKVRRLSDTYLDLDLLDERARDILGVARPGEIILHLDFPQPSSLVRTPPSENRLK